MAKIKQPLDPKHIADVCALLFASDAKTATKYLSEKLVVRATWAFKPTLRNLREDIRVTIGEPNYLARKFIAACKKSGEPFPVKKIQLTPYPIKRAKRK